MHRIIHLGPISSRGGMSEVMKNLINNPPDGFTSTSISTHSDGKIISKILEFYRSRKILKQKIKLKEIDLAHVHVTHSISWWRKRRLLKLCVKNDIPTIMHIHSGRFQEFCSSFFGIPGISVKAAFKMKRVKVVILEKRWKGILDNWIPSDSRVINNFTEKKVTRIPAHGEKIRLLMMARESKGKGHDLAIKILDEMINLNVDVELVMTGKNNRSIDDDRGGRLDAKGWVSEAEKKKLMRDTDFIILPSEFEGSSMTVIESIVNKIPCIVSGASSETIGIGEMVVESNDPKIWSAKIIQLSKESEYINLINKIEVRSQEYSVDKIKGKWRELYSEMINEL